MALEYLKTKSRVVQELDNPTLEEILTEFCKTHKHPHKRFARIVALLERLSGFDTDTLKLSNCVIDGTLPYDSLIGTTPEDLELMLQLIDYLDLPDYLKDKLIPVVKNGKHHYDYIIGTGERFNKNTLSHWSYIGDIRGLKWAHKEGCTFGFHDMCVYAAKQGHLECLQYAHYICGTTLDGYYSHTHWHKNPCMDVAKTPEIKEWIMEQKSEENCWLCEQIATRRDHA